MMNCDVLVVLLTATCDSLLTLVFTRIISVPYSVTTQSDLPSIEITCLAFF